MKGIDIKADKNRTLRYSINTMITFKRERGVDFATALSSLENGLDFELLRYIFYLGLRWEDPELTEDKAGEIMDIIIEENGIEGLSNILVEAVQMALGVKEAQGDMTKNQVSH